MLRVPSCDTFAESARTAMGISMPRLLGDAGGFVAPTVALSARIPGLRMDISGRSARSNWYLERRSDVTLDQEIEGSNPSAPAKPQDVGLVLSTTLQLVVLGPISVLAEED